ncbi:MAG: purine-nucleoside phosphorylase [Oscillospiraceae bacterium]|nr:purine-nucleoside phosphorylase [Oscillospiraceae bacterium]
MKTYYEKVVETAEFLRGFEFAPEMVLVLGSGLADMADLVKNPIEVPYSDVPNFPEPKVAGHKGKLVFGELFSKKAAVVCGRFHPYEGHSMAISALPIAALAQLGAARLIVTNAAGGVNREFNPGDIMLISDHINLTGDSPLHGNYSIEFGGEQFTDLTDCYDKNLREKIKSQADFRLQEGVYAYRLGPFYETPAEVLMLRLMGADAVGMSTIPESLIAKHLGMEVVGFSLISNKAAGYDGEKLNHEEVLEAGKSASENMKKVIEIAMGA